MSLRIQNPDGHQVLSNIEKKAEYCYDLTKTAEEAPATLQPVGTIDLALDGGKYGRVTGSAKLQLLDKIKVPAQFFNRCTHELKENIFKEFYKKKNFLFRCMKYASPGGDFGPDTIRAVLGPRYPTNRDDKVLFPIVVEALNQSNIELAQFGQEDYVTELVARFTDASTSLDGQTVTGSISITNSETGHSSLWIEPTIQIFNGMWLSNRYGDGQTGSRYVHRGELPSIQELKEDIENAKRIAQIGVIQFLEKSKETMDVAYATQYLDDLSILPKRFSNIIANEIKDQERILKVELLRRILLAADQMPLIQSLQVRRQVGQLVGLFQNTSSRFANLANEVNQ